MNGWWMAGAATCAVACGLGAAGATYGTHPLAPAQAAGGPHALVDFAEQVVAAGEVAGVEVYVERAGEVLVHEAVGSADLPRGVALNPGRLHNLRSMTKPVGGTLAQLLIDDGVLSPDDRVADYLDSFRGDRTGTITIEELLTHRAGYVQGVPGRPWRTFASVQALARAWGQQGPSRPRDGSWSYADAHADILAAVMEAATGQPLDALVRERVLEPLGMHDTLWWDGTADPRSSRILPLHWGSTGNWPVSWRPEEGAHYPYPMLSQSLHGTASDYAAFLRAWMDALQGRSSLISATAARRAFANRAAIAVPPGFSPLAEGRTLSYGHMWGAVHEAPTDPDEPPFVITHQGSDGTFAWAFPELDLIVLVLTQSRGQAIHPAVERVLASDVVNPLLSELR